MKLAVFASGTGSNFLAMLEDEGIKDKIELLVSDKPDAKAIQTAKEYGISFFSFDPKDYENKAAYEREIKDLLQDKAINFIILAGYMRLIGHTLLSVYEGKIINVHPSDLPNFPGKDAIGQALRAKVKETGVTIHYVDAGMDTGPIIAQEKVAIQEEDSLETLMARIQDVEHRLYPKVIKQLMEDL